MVYADNKNAPNVFGWVAATAAGLVALCVTIVVGRFDLTPAVAIAGGVFLLVGLILGMPRPRLPGPGEVHLKTPPAPVAGDVARTAPAHAVPAYASVVGSEATQPETGVFRTADAQVAQPAAFAAAAAPATAYVAMVPAAGATETAGGGPTRLTGPRAGYADNLKEIEGIGPSLEKLCHGLGFYHFDQIARWTDADVAWVDVHMTGFKGRIVRDRWVAQARLIQSEGLEAFRRRIKTNDY